jgi:hypothetical protein
MNHEADQAIETVLTTVGRVKVQDFLDLTHLDRTYISLGVAVWAAAGKAKGFTPEFIMERLRRNCRINPNSTEGAKLEHPFDPVALKKEWLECFTAAEELMATFPHEPLGCLYLDQNGQPARGKTFDPNWVPHYGSVKGAWPKIGD